MEREGGQTLSSMSTLAPRYKKKTLSSTLSRVLEGGGTNLMKCMRRYSYQKSVKHSDAFKSMTFPSATVPK